MRGKRNSANGSSQPVSNASAVRAQVGCDVGDVMNQEVRQAGSAALGSQNHATSELPAATAPRAGAAASQPVEPSRPARHGRCRLELVDGTPAARWVLPIGEQPQRAVGHPRLAGRPGRSTSAGGSRRTRPEFVETLGAALVNPALQMVPTKRLATTTVPPPVGQSSETSRRAAQQRVRGRAAKRDVAAAAAPPCVPSTNASVVSRARRLLIQGFQLLPLFA